MNPDPLTDAVAFLCQLIWPVILLWALLLGSLLLAVRAWRRQMPPPDAGDVAIWLARVLVGCLWWQKSMWKVPPHYDELLRVLDAMAQHTALPMQATTIHAVEIPHIALFGPLVYGMEVVTALCLILGVLSRLGALVGLVLAAFLWLGWYSVPDGWPWGFATLVILHALWACRAPGRSLGADALVRVRHAE